MNYSIYNSVGLLQENDNLPNYRMLSSMRVKKLKNLDGTEEISPF